MTGQFPPATPPSGRDDSRRSADEIRERIAELKQVLEAARERALMREGDRP